MPPDEELKTKLNIEQKLPFNQRILLLDEANISFLNIKKKFFLLSDPELFVLW